MNLIHALLCKLGIHTWVVIRNDLDYGDYIGCEYCGVEQI